MHVYHWRPARKPGYVTPPWYQHVMTPIEEVYGSKTYYKPSAFRSVWGQKLSSTRSVLWQSVARALWHSSGFVRLAPTLDYHQRLIASALKSSLILYIFIASAILFERYNQSPCTAAVRRILSTATQSRSKALSGVFVWFCLRMSVCLFVRARKPKQLKLKLPNSAWR